MDVILPGGSGVISTELRLLILMLDYSGGSDVITRVLIRRGRGQREMRRCYLLALTTGRWPPAKECRWPPEAGKGKKMNTPLEPPERNAALQTPSF